MIDKEFNEWWADVKTRFPEQVHWFADGKTIEQQRATFRTWLEILATVEVDDAIEANRQLQADGGRLHFDQLPALVRSKANLLQADREEITPEMQRRLKYYSARKLHNHIVQEAQRNKCSREQLQHELRQRLPADYFQEVCSGPSVAELRKQVGL